MSSINDDSEEVHVCAADDLQPYERTIVRIDGLPVSVCNIDGELYAFQAVCPHQGGPVCEGKIDSQLEAEFVGAGEMVEKSFSDDSVIACPWHGWEFELSTGRHIGVPEDESVSLQTFSVSEEDGEIVIKF